MRIISMSSVATGRRSIPPPAHPGLGRAGAVIVGQLVVRDREQPRRRGRRAGAEPRAGVERRGERLRGEVGGGLGIARPALEVGQQRLHVAVVEAAEVLRLA
jgi:hypothetical protein